MRTRTVSARLIALLTLLTATAAGAAPVSVKVFESTAGTNTTYFYRVQNDTTQPVVSVRIGFDSAADAAQLPAAPVGWTFDDGLPASSATAPPGWEARVVTTEENDLFDLEWSSDQGSSFDIPAGATATGFSVKLAEPTAAYRTSAFVVTLGDGTIVSGSLEPDTEAPGDTTPPVLSVTLSPAQLWPPNHKMITITASISASDNSGSAPAIRLVSITANETLEDGDIGGAAFGTDDRQFALRAERSGQNQAGRIYTVTYSATDAAGNSASAQATVTVPHDQGH